jgi:hypothetical protein
VSGTATLTAVGDYCWHAHFEPNPASAAVGVQPADDNGANECFTVSPVTPTLTTQATCAPAPCVVGSTLSDTATLGGNGPTSVGTATQPGTNGANTTYPSINATNGALAGGSITWTAFGPNDCTTVAMAATSRDVSGDNTYPTTTQTPVSFIVSAPGTYTFVASYSGSPNTNGAGPTGCPDTSGHETITITHLATQQNAVTGTNTLSIGTGTVSSGTDTATLTVSSGAWGGTLTWYLCGPVPIDVCDSHGVQVTTRTVSNTSPATDFVSGTATLTAVGDYCWHAHFEPNPASAAVGVQPADDNGANECFTVSPVTPTLTTQATCTSTPCVLGVDTLSDTATLGGAATQPGTNGANTTYPSINATNGALAGGSITWVLYGPTNGGCTDSKTPLSPSSSPPSTAFVSGNSTYGPVSYMPVLSDGIGTYTFVASYPGNSPNTNAATPTTCPDTSGHETITVIGSASSSSAQRWLPNDRVVLTTTGGTLNGTLTVTLYSGTFSGPADNCTKGTATAVTGQSYTFTTSGDASGTAYNTNNTTFYVGTNPDGTPGGAAGPYFWLIHYQDNNLTSPTDRCESSNVTISDG